ncbi:MAG: hypothetical protein IPJ43_14775 [Saprospiraceae bacterium]|nr:hypothetical protein [Saprospiraceae bacterium]
MKTQEILIAHPKTTEEVEAIKAVLHAMKIRFEISNEEDYNPDFVAKILESKEQAKNGKVTRVEKENLKEFLGL